VTLMNKLYFTTSIMFLSLMFAVSVQAQALRASSLPYKTYYTPEARNNLAPSLIDLKFDGKFDVWYLLGEPVINCSARWLNNEQLSVKTPGGDTIIAQQGEVEVYNLMLVAQLWDPERDKKRAGEKGGHIAAFCDAGIVAQNGNKGFNVAGSPNWDKFLCNLPSKFYKRSASPFAAEEKQGDLCEEAGGSWFSADAAKKMARAGLKFEDVTVKSVEVYAGAAIRRYEKAQWRDKSFAYKEKKATAIQNLMQKEYLASNRVNGVLESINVMGRIVSMRYEKGSQTATPRLLNEYDNLLIELQGKLADSGAFSAEWREKDQALVREQLAHLRAIEPGLLHEEAKLAEYRNALKKKAENEPDGTASPMDVYRSATLMPFAEGLRCGLKKPDGTTIVNVSDVKCTSRKMHDDYGIYLVSQQTNGGWDRKMYDNNGNLLFSSLGYNFHTAGMPFGLVEFSLSRNGGNKEIYSILTRQIVLKLQSDYNTYPHLRNNRQALVIRKRSSACQNTLEHSYFYLDTERIEETGICTEPQKDPLNTKVE
jgi:hypothetical protein